MGCCMKACIGNGAKSEGGIVPEPNSGAIAASLNQRWIGVGRNIARSRSHYGMARGSLEEVCAGAFLMTGALRR